MKCFTPPVIIRVIRSVSGGLIWKQYQEDIQ